MRESSKSTQASIFRHSIPHIETPGDFTTNWRVIPISGLAIVIGVVSAYVAVALLRLIGFFAQFGNAFSCRRARPGKSPGGNDRAPGPAEGA